MSDQTDIERRIVASPTKEFFIYMLVKDLDLTRAISDLVDNCIDGAKRLRKDNNYNGLEVYIEASEQYFKISDNCGGIPVEVARKYAFRFGRADGTPTTEYSIGRFGVGMKRALFKIGKTFSIESITENSRFIVKQNVEEWAHNKDDWDFHFNELQENFTPTTEHHLGTVIKVTDLYPGIAEEFALANYQTRLSNELTADHQMIIEQGLKIYLNGISLKSSPLHLLVSDKITPAYSNKEIKEEEEIVAVKIYAGLAEPEPSKAGWHIFCNERLILKADQSRTTGWGREAGNPNYHNDYARFRGFAFFNSTQSNLLPWNTTKSDVDSDLPLYRSVRLEMINIMKPVIHVLREDSKDKRKLEEEDKTPLEKIIEEADFSLLSSITHESPFSISPPKLELLPTEQEAMKNIQYSKPESEVIKVQKLLEAKTLREVGEKTFDYFVKMECDEE
ncbi:ATP-binding protein [Nostoc sp.]|uniref:ATP-binding protein n=1 Tax=Nostoc sp. TaxID=1180 RepID=UPI002FF74566